MGFDEIVVSLVSERIASPSFIIIVCNYNVVLSPTAQLRRIHTSIWVCNLYNKAYTYLLKRLLDNFSRVIALNFLSGIECLLS